MPTNYDTLNSLDNFSIIGGADYVLKITVLNQDGSAADLTSASGVLKIAPYGQPLATLQSISHSSIAANVISFIITVAMTTSLNTGKYIFQPVITDSLSQVHRPGQGTLTLQQAIA